MRVRCLHLGQPQILTQNNTVAFLRVTVVYASKTHYRKSELLRPEYNEVLRKTCGTE